MVRALHSLVCSEASSRHHHLSDPMSDIVTQFQRALLGLLGRQQERIIGQLCLQLLWDLGGEQDRGSARQGDEARSCDVTGGLLCGQQLALRPPLSMILGEVAVLAHPVRVLRPVVVRTRIRRFFPPVCMIAVLAHAFGVENAVDVRTLGDLAAGASLLLRLLGLLRLTRHT